MPFSPARSEKGNEKRETQQNPMPFSPAKSEKGNENRGNPRNPMPFSPARSEKGNEKRETPKIRCPSHAFPKKGYRIGELHQDAAPLFYILSAITAKVIFIQEKEKNIKFVKKCLRKIRLSFIIYMENVTKIKGIYYEGRKGYDEKKNT